MNTLAIIGWVGSIIMVAASFLMGSPTIGLPMAITGLFILNTQAIGQKNWNLVFSNSVTIVGLSYSLWSL